jgi:cyclopropane fatty-acyl-phospholipid synthase-like methyltransferase
MAAPNSIDNLSFEEFRRLASDASLSKYERIGFPDSYRAGFEDKIFADIRHKLTNLETRQKQVVDIGPGCSELPEKLIQLCDEHQHSLTLIDNAEMLAHLPDKPFVRKVDALFPDCDELINELQGTMDIILSYSVLHYVLVDVAFFRFLDVSLSLLAPGGQFLIGDIPNASKRKRFFHSDSGIDYHKKFMQTDEPPEVKFNQIENDQIDDAIIFAILQRSRAAGFDAYVLPQEPGLPLANRREDILITRP